MRFLISLAVSAVCLVAADSPKPALQQIHNVYLLPMGNGLDQYLANRLTTTGLFKVVTDPQKADALFTDQLGAGFEQKLDELYPEAKPEPKEKKSSDDSINDAMQKPQSRAGSFSRGRGTVFLVERSGRSVVWSMYHPVKGARPDDTNRRADEIAKKLAKDIQGPKPASK